MLTAIFSDVGHKLAPPVDDFARSLHRVATPALFTMRRRSKQD
jgi:hypothetical protein